MQALQASQKSGKICRKCRIRIDVIQSDVVVCSSRLLILEDSEPILPSNPFQIIAQWPCGRDSTPNVQYSIVPIFGRLHCCSEHSTAPRCRKLKGFEQAILLLIYWPHYSLWHTVDYLQVSDRDVTLFSAVQNGGSPSILLQWRRYSRTQISARWRMRPSMLSVFRWSHTS